MRFLEKDLEEIIFNNKREIFDRGLYVPENSKRQFRIGNYGIADIVSFDRHYYGPNYMVEHEMTITVFELKQEKISVSTFMQAIGYINGIKQYLNQKQSKLRFAKFKIVLVGSCFELSTGFVYLLNILNSDNFELECYTYSYNFDGLSFKRIENYCLTDQGF